MATINHLHSIRCVFPVFLPTAGSEHESWRPTRPGYLSTLRPSRAMDQISFPVVCFLNTCFHSATLTHSLTHIHNPKTHQRLSHHHLDLLLSQHSKFGKQALDDKLPGLELGVDGDVGHGGDVVFLPQVGRHRGGGTASTHAAAADGCRRCGADKMVEVTK